MGRGLATMGHQAVAMARHTLYIDSDSASEEERPPHPDAAAASAEEHEVKDRDPQAGGAGLTAAELPDERLFPGDTIEYYSMAFVFGDPRGYRIAKVLKVMHEEREYPLRLDSQEMLPCTQMIKRKLNRRGQELETGTCVWRKIRTFGLVDGHVKDKTRADTLNEGLKNAMSSAFKSVRSELTKREKDVAKTSAISSFFARKDPSKTLEKQSKASTPAKSDRKEPRFIDDSPRGVKIVMKRPRIQLTPESGKNKQSDCTRTPSPLHRTRKEVNGHSAEARSSRGRNFGSPKPKIRLQAFLDSIEERKRDPKIRLDDYLALEQEEKIAIAEFKCAGVGTSQQPTSSGSFRMRATPKDSKDRNGERKKPSRIKSLHNYFKAPPRPHPDSKTTAKGGTSSTLNFMMDAENDISFNHTVKRKDALDRSCDLAKSPKRKGLVPKQKLMGTWVNTTKR